MALRLAQDPDGLLGELADALTAVKGAVRVCSLCSSLTTTHADPCSLCTDPARDDTVLCVVEDANDILMIERSGGFRGRYFALTGKLSPAKGEGPAEIRARRLLERVTAGTFKEIVLALDTDVESDATASFIAELLRNREIKITRLAVGLPAGSGIMYSDPLTLERAFTGRREY